MHWTRSWSLSRIDTFTMVLRLESRGSTSMQSDQFSHFNQRTSLDNEWWWFLLLHLVFHCTIYIHFMSTAEHTRQHVYSQSSQLNWFERMKWANERLWRLVRLNKEIKMEMKLNWRCMKLKLDEAKRDEWHGFARKWKQQRVTWQSINSLLDRVSMEEQQKKNECQ